MLFSFFEGTALREDSLLVAGATFFSFLELSLEPFCCCVLLVSGIWFRLVLERFFDVESETSLAEELFSG